MVAFGPEELARCSIKGTAKGRRSGDAEQQEKKDPLDSTILNAVLGKSPDLSTTISIPFNGFYNFTHLYFSFREIS